MRPPLTPDYSKDADCRISTENRADFLIRCHEYVTSVDHLLGAPFESLDGIWNSATMEGVLGWSNQLAEKAEAMSARAR
jgi:hypothetical protein